MGREGEREKMKDGEYYKVEMQYTLSTPEPTTIVVTVICKGEPKEMMGEANNFIKLLDKEIRRFLERRAKNEGG